MAMLELLDPRRHGNLRLRARGTDFPHFIQIVASEFPVAATCCPILFTKEASTGAFYAGAMFGFKPGEVLVGPADEQRGFVPLMLQREGFFISGQHISIDREHTRFSESEGAPMFDDAQQPGDALRAIQRTLGEIHQGLEQTKAFIAALLELKLIEPIDISLSFDGGERLSLQGLYTVSLDRLRDLDDGAALRLFRAGHLQLAYTMAASLRQIARLARVRDRRSAGAGHHI
ncbi:MAG TPA: SapC family protein [Steroidobacteraceae bacterium]|nr:SapC family protein [Steroidobacteraceae bacterium]